MSRVILEPINPEHEVVIGLDIVGLPAIDGFFVQVFHMIDPDEDDETLVNEMALTGAQAVPLVRRYADLKHGPTRQRIMMMMLDTDPGMGEMYVDVRGD